MTVKEDPEYARGWDDCLDIVVFTLEKSGKNIDTFKRNILKLQRMVKRRKFTKIKHHFGAFDIF